MDNSEVKTYIRIICFYMKYQSKMRLNISMLPMLLVVCCALYLTSIILHTKYSIMPRVEEIMRIFGRNIQKLRLNLNISQEELADRAGLHRTYIGMVERSERSISLQNAKKIADALNVKIDNLLEND